MKTIKYKGVLYVAGFKDQLAKLKSHPDFQEKKKLEKQLSGHPGNEIQRQISDLQAKIDEKAREKAKANAVKKGLCSICHKNKIGHSSWARTLKRCEKCVRRYR